MITQNFLRSIFGKVCWGCLLAAATSFVLAQTPGSRADYAAPRLDAWRVLGPGGGGAQFYPAISPHDPNLVLVACDMTGSYISQDGGNSWRMFNLGEPTSFFAFDPLDPRVLYAGAQNLWRSSDAGRTWNLIFPTPSSVRRVVMPDDHASPTVETGAGPAPPVTALAVDPSDSKTLYAAAGRAGQAALYVSTDGGASWQRSADSADALAAGARKIYVDPHSSPANRTLYVIAKNSVSIRKGGSWRAYPPPMGVAQFKDVAAGFVGASGSLTIYALGDASAKGISSTSSAGALLISRDGGITWSQTNDSLLRLAGAGAPLPELRAVAASANHPEVAYLSYSGLRSKTDSKTDYHGVARTSDGGHTWELVWKETESAAANVHDAWITERFGSGWGENPLSLGVAPNNPDICYGTDFGRTLRTTNGGQTWEAVYAKRLPDHTYATTGLDVTTDYGVFFDPFDARRMFIAYTDIGLFRSENGGASWTSATTGVPPRWVNTTYWITFDPAVRGRVWGVMSYVHDLPRPKMWRRTAPATFQGGVCISDDGGKTWRASSSGMPPTAATHILLDPKSPPEARVLYVAALGQGVFKSVDGGHTWSLKNSGLIASDGGLPGTESLVTEPFAWRLAQDKKGTLYLVVARRSEDGTFGNSADGALYRSSDGAEHWSRIALPLGVNGPNGIAIDPENPRRLYLAAWGRKTDAGAVQGGVYVSSDGGNSWRNTLARDQHVYDVTIDPHDASKLYACGFESSAWRSTDRGETWQRIRGYNFKWGHRVIPDPQDPAMIYVTTFGGSVWHGPAAGDPQAREDIVTPELAYGRFGTVGR